MVYLPPDRVEQNVATMAGSTVSQLPQTSTGPKFISPLVPNPVIVVGGMMCPVLSVVVSVSSVGGAVAASVDDIGKNNFDVHDTHIADETSMVGTSDWGFDF